MTVQTRFLLDFLACAANTFLTDLADCFVASLTCFALFVGYFGELYHYELALATILGVELHDGMSGSSTAAEEVENNRIFITISNTQ